MLTDRKARKPLPFGIVENIPVEIFIIVGHGAADGRSRLFPFKLVIIGLARKRFGIEYPKLLRKKIERIFARNDTTGVIFRRDFEHVHRNRIPVIHLHCGICRVIFDQDHIIRRPHCSKRVMVFGFIFDIRLAVPD